MKNVKVLTTLNEIKSFTDPYRIIIMKHYFRLNKPSTVKQIADEMGDVPAKVHYHVKKLETAGILRLNHTKEINGIVAKYYEPTARTYKIENQEIGKFQFNNQVVDFLELSKSQIDNPSEQSKTALYHHALYLSPVEFEAMMGFLENLRMSCQNDELINNSKKYAISVACTE
jgi:predicted transcriptional regulator